MSSSDNHQKILETAHKQLIIGAGFVGLGIAQALKEAGILYDQVDASDQIGGNWYHGVYETAHIISSRKVTQFTNFPMPEDYPDFPSAQNMRDYINAFADHFNLREPIELNRKVSYVRPVENNLWEVTFNNQEQRIYKAVVMCYGHHWCKRFPKFEGEFKGATWVIRTHRIEYFKPILAGEQIAVLTWISNWRRARSLRKYKFLRLAEPSILAAAETDLVFVDSQTGRPRTIPESVSGLFELLPPNEESRELDTFVREHSGQDISSQPTFLE